MNPTEPPEERRRIRLRTIAAMSGTGGGIASYVSYLTSALEGAGAEVEIQSDRGGPESPFALGANRRPVWDRDPRYPFENLRATRDGGFDVLHVHHEFTEFGGPATAMEFPLLLLFLRLCGRPVVTTIHGVVPTEELSRIEPGAGRMTRAGLRLVTRWIGRLSDQVIVHDDHFRAVLVDRYGLDGIRVRTIPHGVHADLPVSDRVLARRRLGIDGEARVILSLGYLARYKGLETIIDAFVALAREDPKLLLLLAGGAPARSAESGAAYLQALRERVPPELRDRVRFPGRVPEESLPDYFGATDLVVVGHLVPLASSGILALAQAHGRATIASDLPQFATVVPDPRARFPPGNPEALAATMRRYLQDPEALARLASEGRAEAARRDWKVVAGQHLKLYRELARPGAPP